MDKWIDMGCPSASRQTKAEQPPTRNVTCGFRMPSLNIPWLQPGVHLQLPLPPLRCPPGIYDTKRVRYKVPLQNTTYCKIPRLIRLFWETSGISLKKEAVSKRIHRSASVPLRDRPRLSASFAQPVADLPGWYLTSDSRKMTVSKGKTWVYCTVDSY